jgi:predicted Zn-dependent peptidase
MGHRGNIFKASFKYFCLMTSNSPSTQNSPEHIVLENGLQIILQHKPGLAATVQCNVEVGSVCEMEGEKGYSHLVEHMLFEGTTNRKNAQIICSEIENLGGDINAATSTETTSYHTKTLSKHVPVAIDVLSDMILNPLFDATMLEKEKSVVLEEIKVIDDQPRYFQWITFEKSMYENSNYADPVYGFIKDVSDATKESLTSYYKKHYGPSRTTIIIVGNLESQKETLVSQIKSIFGSWKNDVPLLTVDAIPTNSKRALSIPKDIQQIYSILGVICPTASHEDAPVLEVIEAILGKPQSGRLYNEIRNKSGLAYDVSISYDAMQKFGVFAVNIVAEKEKHSVAIKKIMELLEMKDVTENEMLMSKQYIEGRLLLELESTYRISENLAFWYSIAGKDNSAEYLEKILSVSLDDIERVRKKYFSAPMTHIQLVPK